MADFSNELFSFNGESPDFLPVRIRLPNGQTRYTQSVTLEELNSCGFTGPISIPEHTVEERLVWSKDNLCYEIHPHDGITCDEARGDFLARQVLRTILSNRTSDGRNNLTDSGKDKFDKYYATTVFLLTSTECLTKENVPNLELEVFDYANAKETYQSSFDWFDDMKYNYEVNGCFAKPEDYSDSVMAEVYRSFIIPPSWVPSGTAI